MTKYVKVTFKDKNTQPLYFTLDRWSKMLESDKILIPYSKEGQDWNGDTFNKLEIMKSEYDEEYTAKMNESVYGMYLRKSDNVVVKLLEDQLPDDFENYQKVSSK